MAEGYNGAYTGQQIDEAIGEVRQKKSTWDGKQDKLTFDTAPTADSTNPVTSGGVKEYIDTTVGDIAALLDTI